MTERSTSSVTTAGRILAQIADYVQAQGHDAEGLCRRAGLQLAVLRAPDVFVPLVQAERFGLEAVALTGDPHLGRHLAQVAGDPSAFDPGLLMMMSSASLGEALSRMERLQRYWGDGPAFSVLPSETGVRIRYTQPGALGAYQRHSDECALAKVVLGMRALTGLAVTAKVVCFRHAAPEDTAPHEALFGCPIAFDAEHSELALPLALLDTQLPHANQAYCAIFEQQVARTLARLPGKSGLSEHVRAAVQATLSSGDCTLASAAKRLGMSERTLQRRLKAEGTSFAELVDVLRSELAGVYLAQAVPVQEIAWLLGYAEPSAFHHAFRRWTGKTPEQARAERTGVA
jgi:AraC-like DNA-binding protein